MIAIGPIVAAIAVGVALGFVLDSIGNKYDISGKLGRLVDRGLAKLAAIAQDLEDAVATEQRPRAPGEPPRKGTLKRTKAFVIGLLVCLALYPILSVTLRAGIGSYLEAGNYTAQVADQRLRDRPSTLT